MSLLESYVLGLRSGDAEKMGAVFAEDGLFHDEAPTVAGMDPIILNGRAAIVENFGALLANGGITIDNVAFNQNAMRYDIVMSPDFVIRCLGVYQDRDGLITEYRVTAVG